MLQMRQFNTHTISFGIAVFMVVIFAGSHLLGIYRPLISEFGASIQSPIYTYITYAFLHGSLLHIGFNTLFLLQFGPMVEAHLGRRRFIIFTIISAVISGLGGVWLAYAFGKYILLIGFSGVLFAYLGYYYGLQWIQSRDRMAAAKHIAQQNIFLIIYLFIPFVIPMGISGEAHIAGLITGLAFAIFRKR